MSSHKSRLTLLAGVIAAVLGNTASAATNNPSQPAGLVPGTAWDWQLGLNKPTTANLDKSSNPRKMIDIDMELSTPSIIAGLKSKGIVVICYINAGAYENWRSDKDTFPKAAIGSDMDGWPGEKWLDIRHPGVLAVMQRRMDVAVSKGCDGIEPDNIDGYTNGTGFNLTAQDQLNFNISLANAAHSRKLLIALKNDVDQVARLAGVFDFAINEQCNQYKECEVYSNFIRLNKAVFNAEYSRSSTKWCPAMNNANIDSVGFALSLNNKRYQSCR